MIPQIMHLPYLLLPTTAAFLLLSLFLFRGRRSLSPRCPKCWYDMSGAQPLPEGGVGVASAPLATHQGRTLAPSSPANQTPPADSNNAVHHPLRCPECGHTAPNQAALHRPRRRKKLAAFALLIALASAAAALPRLPRTLYYAFMPTWHATQTVSLPGYEARILEHTDPEKFGRAVELKDAHGQTLFHMDGMYFTIGDTHNAAAKPIGIGEDITGDSVPDLIITHNTGGSGCQETHYLFQLGTGAQPEFAPLATLDFCGYFEDKDHDGIPEFIASDRTFAYRWTSGAGSPHPEVILRWHKDQHRYVVAPDLMLRAPNTAELDALRLKLTSDPKILNEERRSRSLATALDLIYSGSRDQGLRFLEATWPERGILSTFLAEFQKALDESPFAAEVRDLQTLPSSPPNNKP